jgi:hypothetical protein
MHVIKMFISQLWYGVCYNSIILSYLSWMPYIYYRSCVYVQNLFKRECFNTNYHFIHIKKLKCYDCTKCHDSRPSHWFREALSNRIKLILCF